MVLQRSNLTPRDRDLLVALTRAVRVLSVNQIAAHWFAAAADAGRAATRRLGLLQERGFVEVFQMPACPEVAIPVCPLTEWEPGNAAPDFVSLARTLAQRWTQPAAPVSCVVATSASGTWLGGAGGRRPRRSEISHDLLLGELYLGWRRRTPDGIAEWISESRLRRLGYGDQTRLPDAMVDAGGVRRVIEVGGEYSASKLAEFHEFCATRGLSYELW